jgi:hypothetical protein
MRGFQEGISIVLTGCLLLLGGSASFAYQGNGAGSAAPPQAAQQSAEQLQQLVAPIALYRVLSASLRGIYCAVEG